LETLRSQEIEQSVEQTDQGCQTGLVAGAQSSSVIAVEVLLKPNIVATARVVLEPLCPTKNWPPSIFIELEDALFGIAIGKMEGLKRSLYMGGYS